MNKQRTILMALALALMGGTALGMHWLKTNQRLGKPGIKTSAIAGSPRLNIYLPEQVLNYNSVVVPTETNVLDGLPHDTSFMRRYYVSPRNEYLCLSVVLMGNDRTSLHKPQFCLTGSGWNIDDSKSSVDTIRVEKPHPYDLQVMKLITSQEDTMNGGKIKHLIYVYWFVADNELSARHETRMWQIASHWLRTGELQRWAYVSCYAECNPEDDIITYERIKNFIAASVPSFQLATRPRVAENESLRTASR
jgi:hypothetical protein